MGICDAVGRAVISYAGPRYRTTRRGIVPTRVIVSATRDIVGWDRISPRALTAAITQRGRERLQRDMRSPTACDAAQTVKRHHRGRHLGARYGARHLGARYGASHLGARYGARHLGAARMDKGVATPGTARLVAPGTAPGGFGAVVGGLLSVVPIRRATSKRWTTHKLSLRRRAALSVLWCAHNGAWRACPPCVLLLLTPALLT